jgi:hypothetical protein
LSKEVRASDVVHASNSSTAGRQQQDKTEGSRQQWGRQSRQAATVQGKAERSRQDTQVGRQAASSSGRNTAGERAGE